METLSPNLVLYLSLNMDVPEVLSLCETSTRYNQLICNNQTFWMNKIMTDFPDLKVDIKEYGPDYRRSYQQLAYRFIQLDFVLNLVDEEKENEDEDEDDVSIEIDTVSAISIFGLRTNLSEGDVRQIIHDVSSHIIDEMLWGYYTIQVDGQDTDCQDMKNLHLECFNDITNRTRSVTILFDASESGDLGYYQDNLQRLLERSIDRAKATYYGL